MGKKYREALKLKKLNKHLWSILVIDDTKIRKQAFSESSKLLKKIDKAEQSIKIFFETDQKLFNSWYDLTFRESRAQIQEKQDEYTQLGEFHNSIIAEAEMNDIECWEAMDRIKKELFRYKNADPKERSLIDEHRRRRSEFARRAIEEELKKSNFDDTFAFTDDNSDWQDEVRSTADFDDLDEDSVLNHHLKMTAATFNKLTTDELKAIFTHEKRTKELLTIAFITSVELGDPPIFLRIWNELPDKLATAVKKHINRELSVDLDALLAQLGKQQSQTSNNNHSHEHQFDFEYGFYRENYSARRKLSPTDEENLKIQYRKLALKLHPDRHSQETGVPAWASRLWEKVQIAYRTQDIDTLKHLMTLVLLRTQNLAELTISEIRQSTQTFNFELNLLNRQISQLRKSHSWGFSKLKSFANLSQKVNKDLDQEMAAIQEKIDDLRSYHHLLELEASLGGMRRQRRKQNSRSKNSLRKARPSYPHREKSRQSP